MKTSKKRSLIFANVVLGGLAILFILAIAYSYYRSNVAQVPLNYKLVALFIAGLLLSVFTFFMRDSWKNNIAALVFSVLLAAYGVELVLLAQHKNRLPQIEIDPRNKLEVLEDLRAKGIDAWPHVIPYLFVESNGLLSDNTRIFPLGGISLKTIVYCNESGQYMNFKSDEYGFNNPMGLYRKGVIQVALIGDSFTLGNCVKQGEDIAGRLRNHNINALNLGNGGNGPLIELAELKEYVEPIKPDIVLWIYYEGNDLYELEQEQKSPMLMSYLEGNYSQNLLERQREIDRALLNYVDSKWKKELDRPQIKNRIVNRPLLLHEEQARDNRRKVITLWHLRSKLRLLSSQPPMPVRKTDYKSQLTLFSEIITKANQRTSNWGGKFYFVYLPDMDRYANDNLNETFLNRADVLNIIHELRIPLIDFHEVLDRHPKPLSLTPFLGAHYNTQGYKLLSEFIVSRLTKDGLISRE